VKGADAVSGTEIGLLTGVKGEENRGDRGEEAGGVSIEDEDARLNRFCGKPLSSASLSPYSEVVLSELERGLF